MPSRQVWSKYLPIVCRARPASLYVSSNVGCIRDDLRAVIYAANGKISMQLFYCPVVAIRRREVKPNESLKCLVSGERWKCEFSKRNFSYLQRLTQGDGPKWVRATTVECTDYGYTSMFHFQRHFSTTQCLADAYRLREKKEKILNGRKKKFWNLITAIGHDARNHRPCNRAAHSGQELASRHNSTPFLRMSRGVDVYSVDSQKTLKKTVRVHLPIDNIPYRWVTFWQWLF